MRFPWFYSFLLKNQILRARGELKNYPDPMDWLSAMIELTMLEKKYWNMGNKDLKFTVM